MRIKEVWIKNFRGYGENPNDLEGFYKFKDLNNKLILLSGYNGFGKTSFFDAIEWGMTDRLSRIQDLKDIVKTTNLKKSNYLKFHNKTPKDNNRIVEVAIYFEDGSMIRRSSKYDSIDKSGYKSNLTEDSVNTKELKKILLNYNDNNLSDIFDINFLSQENINAILRAKDPLQRTEEFLKLLGLKTIKNIVDKSQIKNLSIVVNKMSKELENIDTKKKKLDDIFSSNGWGNFEQYKIKVKKVIIEISNVQKNHVYIDKQIVQEDKFESYDIGDFIDEVNNCTVKLDKFKGENIKCDKRLELLINKFLIEKILNLNLYIKNVMFLQENNINDLMKSSYNNRINYYNSNLKKLREDLEKVTVCSIEWENVKKTMKNNKISDKTLDEIINKCKTTYKFIALFKKYSNSCNDLEKLFELIKLGKWHKILKRNRKYVCNIKNLSNIIKAEEEKIKESSEISKRYESILSNVRQYVLDENLEYCPVCFNNDFSKFNKKNDSMNYNKLSNKEKLVCIIDDTIIGSNKEIKTLQNNLDKKKNILKYLKGKYSKAIVEKVINKYKVINDLYNVLFDQVTSNLQKIIECNDKHVKVLNNRNSKISESIDNYKRIYKKVFNKEFSDFNEQEIKKIDIAKSKIILGRMKKNYGEKYKIYDITIDALIEKLNSIKKSLEQSDEENNMSILKKKINELDGIINILNKIVPYKFKKENRELLDGYIKYSKKENILKEDFNKFDQCKKDIEIISTNAIEYQRTMIEKRLNSNQLIQFIYEKINPHPFFRRIGIDYRDAKGGGKWINIMDKDGENIFLDHIFSLAQLNTLSLSIFLGLSLNQRISKLNQFFLDDPIQSMDDINILSFIDLLRAILDSKKIDSNIVLSTHDSNFAQLLAIKMRGRKIKTFEFIGYGDEGPEIRIQ
ncbi:MULTISPECIES: AAA family ATPase [Clostridium]|uniref:AAA family ATPase n=1 Tax=Clostridium TaxID=1485 RepID=UPI0008249688|nr:MULTISPECIES: AAA family ATPase [Clostridium]